MKSFINNYLDPAERMSEILFGLIMTLTFTLGADLVVSEGPDAVHEMIVGIIGCNIAWGIIDGLLYVFNSMYGRGAVYRVVRMLWREGPESVRDKLDEHLEETFGGALSTSTRGAVAREILERIQQHDPEKARITRDDLMGALASFLLVVLTSVPAIAPFLVLEDRLTALRVSNLLLCSLLCVIGWLWASLINANPRLVGLSMGLGGLLLVQLTIFLGG